MKLAPALRSDIETACLDAMIATSDDRRSTARFLAVSLTHRKSRQTARRYHEALGKLGRDAHEAILVELARPEYDTRQVRLLARELQQLTRVQPPEPVNALSRADPARRAELVEAWRLRLAEREEGGK